MILMISLLLECHGLLDYAHTSSTLETNLIRVMVKQGTGWWNGWYSIYEFICTDCSWDWYIQAFMKKEHEQIIRIIK